MTGDEIAAGLSEALGKTVSWVGIFVADYEDALAPLVGPAVASGVAHQIRHLVGGGHGTVAMEQTRAALGVPVTSLDAWARSQQWVS